MGCKGYRGSRIHTFPCGGSSSRNISTPLGPARSNSSLVKTLDIIFRIIGYLLVGAIGAVIYDYCYKNVHIRLFQCAILSGVNACGVVILWMFLLTSEFTSSHILFGILSGSVAAISFYLLGIRRRSST